MARPVVPAQLLGVMDPDTGNILPGADLTTVNQISLVQLLQAWADYNNAVAATAHPQPGAAAAAPLQGAGTEAAGAQGAAAAGVAPLQEQGAAASAAGTQGGPVPQSAHTVMKMPVRLA
eukprot:2804746-Prymnesium_polylepis.1